MLLLVVLSLLVLFLMVGTAFIIAAKQSEKAAKIATQSSLQDANAAARGNILDEVILQIVRDTDNPNSALRSHSLLADLYGNDGFSATAASVAWAGTAIGTPTATSGQMLEIKLDANTLRDAFGEQAILPDAAGTPLDPLHFLSPLDDAYAGLVLTFTSGPARGQSTRIVAYRRELTGLPNAGPLFTIMNVPAADGSLIADPTVLATSRFVVNGRPYNGTGVGYNVAPAGLNERLALLEQLQLPSGTLNAPLALLPGTVYTDATKLTNSGVTLAPQWLLHAQHQSSTARFLEIADKIGVGGRGGSDEPYDAPDFQNMLLAAIQDEPEDSTDPTRASLEDMILPSLHRPELINYWAAQLATADPANSLVRTGNAVLLRKVMLRPNHLDHPNFNGSNPELTAALLAYKNATPDADAANRALLQRYVYGPWDVDNDNDGNRDSVWVDVGAPVILGPNGKLVKPLVAILCTDLDGRININTAGTLDMVGEVPEPDEVALADGQESDDTPRGSGWGPAEISARAALGPDSSRALVAGPPGGTSAARVLYGKYGRDGVPGRGAAGTGLFDMMSQIDLFAWPRFGVQTARTNFGSPPDLRARYGNGVNDYGQLVIEATLGNESSPDGRGRLVADSPYEMNLFPEGADSPNGQLGPDAPFSLGELERMLRVYDTDSYTLPDRLTQLGGNASDVNRERNRITAESWSIPGPQVTLPHEMRELLADAANPLLQRLPRSTAELFEIRVRAALNRVDSTLYPLFPTPITDLAARDRVRRVMRQLLAPELAAGMKLNVNRPFGNGRDDSGANETGYGVVDEAGEDAVGDDRGTARRLWASTGAAGEERLDPRFERSDANFVPLDVTWEGDASPAGLRTDRDSLFQRQLLARHIYVLGLTLTVEPDFDGADQARRGDANMARRLAQWAINAVDFRDADGIMTAYEYDANPFDGWAPDGDPRTTADHAGPDGNPGNADDTLVWGAERPELVITETLAWHDRNTTDEADEDPNEGEQPGDSSDPLNEIGGEFDQKFRPRGAFFLELYNPWPASASASLDLHAIDGSGRDLGVNLAAVAGPDRNTPVWRIVIYRDVDPRKDPDDPNPANRPRDIDRTAYFTSFDPQFGDADRQIPAVANWPDDGTAFFNDYDDAFTRVVKPVRPGRYMVIGSGTEIEPGSGTYFAQLGQRQDQLASDRPRKPLRGMEFNLGPASATKSLVRMVDNMAAPGATANRGRVPGDNTRPFIMEAPRESLALEQGAPASAPLVAGSVDSFTDVAMINAASDRTGNKIGRRLTLTEPTNGYPTRFGNVEWVSRTRLEEAGVLPDPSEDGMYCWGGNPRQPKPIDTPLDDGDDDLRNIGTRYNYRRIFLQRLADPLAPYDPIANPYRTVDSATANISVFNGRLPDAQTERGQDNSDAQEGFSSLERGYRGRGQGDDDKNLWTVQPLDREQVIRTDRRRAAFNRDDRQSCLRLIPPMTLGFLNNALMEDNDALDPVLRRVKPDQPFPWLAWNNRPYVSGNELMLAPRLPASKLLAAFTMGDDDNESPYTTESLYDPARDPRQVNEDDKPGFAHLENFFFDEERDPTALANDQPSHLHRLLEYVETPSLYVGSRMWLNPAINSVPIDADHPLDDPRANLRPPFSNVSTFREPGRVNLNTTFSPAVYAGLFHDESDEAENVEPDADNSVHPGPRWDEGDDSLVRSRRGYGMGGADMLALDNAMPTFFTNPIRASGAADLVPLSSMVRSGVEATMLRSTSATPGTMDDAPLFAAETENDYNNWERNAFFRFSPMTRLNNLTTNQSNVYAVWITVGFFEVEQAPAWGAVNQANFAGDRRLYDRVYADGYTFGKEDGLEDGNVRRLRGFYIIDRSRPVAFEPGVDNNVENLLRLRRRIE